MAVLYKDNVDLGNNQLQNAVLQTISSAPGSKPTAFVYFDSGTLAPFVYNGTTWACLDATKLTAAIPNGALVTNPLARVNHTGTQTASTISDFATAVGAIRLDQLTAPIGPVSFGSQQITNVTDPTSAQMAATKNYVDVGLAAAKYGVSAKPSVAIVATSNLALSGLGAIDGVTPVAGTRVLATGQTTASANGVYIAASGAWARSTYDSANEIEPGSEWFVEAGTTGQATVWELTGIGPFTVGTTALSIVQTNAATAYTAQNGVNKSGNVLSGVVVAGGGLTVGSSGFALDTTQATRFSRGTITGNGSATSFTYTHNLGNQVVGVTLSDSSGNVFQTTVVQATANTITISFGSAPANATVYNVICVG